MLRKILCASLFALALKPELAAAQSQRDSHALSPEEVRTFLPLVCLKAVPRPTPNAFAGLPNVNCQRLIGYGVAQRSSLALSAVIYGPLTSPGANEAYVSYYSGLEPHANDNGGGILFTRRGAGWRLAGWYPGRTMRHCLALPGRGRQRMLCLQSYTGQGETDTSVWIDAVEPKQTAAPETVLGAQDDRAGLDPDEANTQSYPCLLGRKTHKAMLLTIEDLIRSPDIAELARSRITYATAADVEAACKSGHFENVRTKAGILRYRVTQARIVVDAPEEFSRTDY